MTNAVLSKRNSDLRADVYNLKVKHQMKVDALNELLSEMKEQLSAKNKVIADLQKYAVRLDENLRKSDEEKTVLSLEIKALKSENDALRDKLSLVTAQKMKNSANSSKPPSTDGFKKPKPASSRERSGKKVGGQRGHKGHTLGLFANPTQINEIVPTSCKCGGYVERKHTYRSKQEVDIEVSLSIREERVFDGTCKRCGKTVRGSFSDSFINPVHYGSNIKALVALLSEHGNVTVNKTAEIINSISGGALHISDGTVINIQNELANNLTEIVEEIKQQLIAGKLLNADETGCRTNGKNGWFQVFCNDRFTLFGYNSKRGSLCIDELEVLKCFVGILVHDHFSSYYSNGKLMTHAECNAHILRYLKAVSEILKHSWAGDMISFLSNANKLKKERSASKHCSFPQKELTGFFEQYDAILNTGDAQYSKAIAGKQNITYYNEERLLLKRLREFKTEHLRFLMDFDVPFDNNAAERCCRILKSKIRSAGCFRSDTGPANYAKIASFISTLRKQDINIQAAIKGVFDGVPPVLSP